MASDGTAILVVGFRGGDSGYVVLGILHDRDTYGDISMTCWCGRRSVQCLVYGMAQL